MIHFVNKIQIIKFMLCAIIMFSALTSCQKEELEIDEPIVIEETNLVSFDLYGAILDENLKPLSDATITIDNHSTSTDDQGVYFFNDIEAYGPRAIITIEHPDYFTMYKTVNVSSDKDFKVVASLSKLENANSIDAQAGGTITTTEGVKIEFPANAFVSADGTAYTGSVDVFSTYINPVSADAHEKFPSDNSVVNFNNDIKILEAFSTVGVELYGSGMEKLQLNKNVKLSLPVDNALLSDAPTSLSLGHYDESLGYWKEEVLASLSGNFYEAEVRHFSYWCALVMADPATIYGAVFEDISSTIPNHPIADLLVKVSLANGGASGVSRTLTDGSFRIRVPKNVDLVLELYANSFNNSCTSAPVYTKSIPALSSDLNLDNIFIPGPDIVTLTGNVVDCMMQPLNAGFIIVENENGNLVVSKINSDGSFSLSMYSCTSVVSITSYDLDFTMMSEPLIVTHIIADLNLGQVLNCEPVTNTPYLLKVYTGQDTIIGTTGTGSDISNKDGNGNYTTLIWNLFNADIQNTTQPLNAGAMGLIISISGLEQQQCVVNEIQFAIPLLDSEGNSKIARMQPGWAPTAASWVQIYNCIDGLEYLHLIGEGFMVDGNGQLITHRDPKIEFEIYFPL